MPDVAASAPLTRDCINPSRLELRSTRTLWILDNSRPSLANEKKWDMDREVGLATVHLQKEKTYGHH